ncbi:hypothetical protein OID55_00955 [Streptomyces sp. NBC_00715]|uniref:hypothetical protein n=1 Tax=Streptomyces sp. NBC_00715 TaxID=2975811 RepID=UPI00386B7974
MLDPHSPEPLITSVLDLDRTLFGDPDADWTIRMTTAKQNERSAFWDTYGPRSSHSPAATWRSLVYETRHLGAIRLERHRMHNSDGVRGTYTLVAGVLAELT